MNIFQLLGLPEEHRKLSNKVTQLVKHFDEVPESRKRGKTFGVQVKKDGVCALAVVRDHMPIIFSRTGKKFTNTGNLCQHIAEMKLPDGVYMGEMLVPKHIASLEEFSGCVNPNRNKPLSHEFSQIPSLIEMHFFDLVSIESFIEGASQTSFIRRHSNLADRVQFGTKRVQVLEYTVYDTVEGIYDAFDFCVSGGEEGIVIRDLDAGWEAGHKGWRVMKLVRGVDYDLVCIGFEEGTGKYEGKVANLIFKWKGGKTIKAMLGKGWTHINAQQMFQNQLRLPGTIFQVYALEESSKGKLRLPKVGELRHDKEEADV